MRSIKAWHTQSSPRSHVATDEISMLVRKKERKEKETKVANVKDHLLLQHQWGHMCTQPRRDEEEPELWPADRVRGWGTYQQVVMYVCWKEGWSGGATVTGRWDGGKWGRGGGVWELQGGSEAQCEWRLYMAWGRSLLCLTAVCLRCPPLPELCLRSPVPSSWVGSWLGRFDVRWAGLYPSMSG